VTHGSGVFRDRERFFELLTNGGFTFASGMFHLTANIGGIAVKRQGCKGGQSVGLAGVADKVEQEVESRRLTCGAESAEEHVAEFGVALMGERLFEKRHGA
jgi:hypothetical protein